MKLLIASVSLALGVMTTAEEAKSNKYTPQTAHSHFFTLTELPL